MFIKSPSLLAGGAALLLTPFAGAQMSFDSAVNLPVGVEPDTAALGDFNADGQLDIAVTTDNPDKIVILTGNAGTFGVPVNVLLGAGVSAQALLAEDFDGDGDVDLAVSLKGNNTVQLVTNQFGVFTIGTSTGVGDRPSHMAAGDLDGDGDPDIVTSNRDDNTISVLINTGGVFANIGTHAAGSEPRAIDLADFNADGILDACVAGHDSRDVLVYLGLGGGNFGAPAIYSVSLGFNLRPDGITAADLNGDGAPDIATSTSGAGGNFVTTFINSGGTFGAPFNYATGGIEPGAVFAADFDIDGDVDVATVNKLSGNVSVLPNTGGGLLGVATLYPVGLTPEQLTGGDLDGNGSPDLVSVNRDSGDISVLFNQNNGGAPTVYCIGAANSAGPGARIGSAGSTSVADNNFVTTVSGLPVGEPGIFYYGPTQIQAPFGDGFRCVGGSAGSVVRLFPFLQAGPSGQAGRLIDFTAPPVASGPGAIGAGSQVNFQFWYRDPAAGGSTFNLSDALSVTLQP